MAQPLPPLARKSSPQPAEIALVRGQTFHGFVSQGTVLHVRQGHAVLTPASRWLAASVWRMPVTLSAGQVYVTQTAGWITLTSDTGACVACRETLAVREVDATASAALKANAEAAARVGTGAEAEARPTVATQDEAASRQAPTSRQPTRSPLRILRQHFGF